MIIQRVSSNSNFISWAGSILLLALFAYLGWVDYQQMQTMAAIQKWAVAYLVSELLLLLLLSDMQRVTRQLMSRLRYEQEAKQQQQAAESKQHQHALSILNNIAASFSPNWHQQMRDALHVASDYLQLPIAILSNIEKNNYQVIVQYTVDNSLQDGANFDLGETYCSITMQSKQVIAIDHMHASEYASHPCYNNFKLESYIGVQVLVEGSPYGTVNFSSTEARQRPFSQLEIEFISLLARWIGSVLERRRYLDAQVEVAQRLKKVSAQLPGMVYQFKLTPDGKASFPYSSDGIKEIYHLTPEQVLNDASAVFDLTHPDDVLLVKSTISESAKRLSKWIIEYRIKYPDGEVAWVAGRAVPEKQPDSSILWHGFITDITERKQIEKLKDEFVSSVSHELRTPLTSIAGAIGLLHGKVLGVLPEKAAEMVGMAMANVQKLQILINDLLDMDKLVAGKMQFDMQTQPLLPILQKSVLDNKNYAEQFKVHYNLSDKIDDIWVNVDSLRLQQVMTNLLSNAAKFSPPNAEVDIVIEHDSDKVTVKVIDHGIGINDNFKPLIFSQFSQADSSDSKIKGGTGLGLAISKQLITRMNGDIGFESTLNHGAEFYIRLPVAIETAQQSEAFYD